jgi:lysyl-tRNA synthetase, class II
MAYADYNDLRKMTEEIISSMVLKLHQSYKLQYTTDPTTKEVVEIDFTPPYPCISIVDEIEKQSGISLPRPLDSTGTFCLFSDSVIVYYNPKILS